MDQSSPSVAGSLARGIASQLAEGFERAVALGLLLLATPLIAFLACIIRFTSGPPAFYRGVRLGRARRTFTIYKLRTLAPEAQRAVGGELLGQRTELITFGGRFLRETRLDELPQLWNIVRGEMRFVGPRPERPEVFAAKCKDIPGYARRFEVKPGLIGVSQLFTPHGTSKRYRTLLDNGTLRGGHGASFRAWIVLYTIWSVLRAALRRTLRALAVRLRRLDRARKEMRRLRRVVPRGAVAYLPGTAEAHGLRVLDMNEECVLLAGDMGGAQSAEFLLDIPVAGRNRPGRRTARCRGRITHRRNSSEGDLVVVSYQAATARSEYMIHQYFLGGSLALPRRGRVPAAAGASARRARRPARVLVPR